MTDLFLKVLNTSTAAVWVVLGVILARLLLKKAPRRMICALWALVALRLIFGGIESPISLLPSSEIIPPKSLYDQTPAIHSGVEIVDNIINPVYSESLRPAPGASVNPLQVWLAVLANLWVLGMGAMAIWAFISCHRVRRQTRESIPAEGVYLCDRIDSPFIFGLFRPRIYLPSGLDVASRAHVIAHEKAHLARRDHWWKPLGFALLTVNWFNPVLWLAYILLCRDIELACDERVVRDFGLEEKKAYSTALLNYSVNARTISACPLAFGEVGVKQRVKSVLNYKKPAFWVILVTMVLTAVLAVGLLTDPVERISEIRYNGRLYVLDHEDVSFFPVEGTSVGELVSILHDTTEHPEQDFQGTNLDESLAGCPLYLEEDRLYLQKFDGSCMAFRIVATEESETENNVSSEATEPKDREADLGITLRVDDADRAGLRLIYTQSGGSDDWTEIVTSPAWSLERWTDDGWVNVLPEDIAWNDILIAVPIKGVTARNIDFEGICGTLDAGRYRIGKTFYGHPVPDDLKSTTEAIEQTFYAEFEVNPLGITISVENVTPNGATLVCTQDGTIWDRILTGSPWNLERFEDGKWVSLMPESTAWTSIAYMIDRGTTRSWNLNWSQLLGSIGPGRYRISKTFWGEMNPPLTLGIEGEAVQQTCYAEFIIESANTTRFSDALRQDIIDDWIAYEAMSWEAQMASSSTPGSCTREFDDWAEVERFVGMSIPNPLEGLETVEKGCWAATPVGYNGALRFHISFSGTRDGLVQRVQVSSGYRRDGMRVAVSASIRSDSNDGNSDTVITTDAGERYEACTGKLCRGAIEYSVRVMGEPGTTDELMALLRELLPYFEEIAA